MRHLASPQAWNRMHEHRTERDWADDALIRSLEESLFRLPAAHPMDEERLRRFAFGTLTPAEEAQVLQELAANPAVQEHLRRLREPLRALSPAPVSEQETAGSAAVLRAFLKERSQWLLRQYGLARSALTVVIDEVHAGLRLVTQGTGWSQVQAPAMTLNARSHQAKPAVSGIVKVVHDDGTTLVLTPVPGRGPTCSLSLADQAMTGEVAFETHQPESPEPLYKRAAAPQPLRGGKVVFQDCPSGVHRIRLPDGRAYEIAILPG